MYLNSPRRNHVLFPRKPFSISVCNFVFLRSNFPSLNGSSRSQKASSAAPSRKQYYTIWLTKYQHPIAKIQLLPIITPFIHHYFQILIGEFVLCPALFGLPSPSTNTPRYLTPVCLLPLFTIHQQLIYPFQPACTESPQVVQSNHAVAGKLSARAIAVVAL